MLAEFIGSSKIKVTCISCGMKWNIGDLRHTPLTYEKTGYKSISSNDNRNSPEVDSSILLLLGVLFVILFAIIIISCLFS